MSGFNAELAPEPEAMTDVEAEVLAAMQKADLPPQFAYAYKKTGLIGVEGKMAAWSPDSRREWDNTVKEYFLFEEASKRPDRPDPQAWSTAIGGKIEMIGHWLRDGGAELKAGTSV